MQIIINLKLSLYLQMFLAYLFIAITWSVGLEGHGPSHEVVPEVRIFRYDWVEHILAFFNLYVRITTSSWSQGC